MGNMMMMMKVRDNIPFKQPCMMKQAAAAAAPLQEDIEEKARTAGIRSCNTVCAGAGSTHQQTDKPLRG
jgi:hypothetical protein